MNYKNLPPLSIIAPISVKGRLNAVYKFFKLFFIIVVIVIGISGVVFLNMKLQSEFTSEQIKIEQQKTLELKHGIVLDTTAKIIADEGKLPISVAKKYAQWIYEAAYKYSIDPILILAVMHTESRFDYKAISKSGPIGLMQIAASFHKDKTTRSALFEPKNNIMVGTQILAEYSARSKNIVSTLLMYNGSLGKEPTYAHKVLKKKESYDAKIMKAISI